VSLLLNIDTSIQTSSVCLARNDIPITLKANSSQKDSAAWLHIAIKEILDEQNISSGQLDAIAVTGGPGSYTGLRVGMATAKGLCYALNKPLIVLNTLVTMAYAAKGEDADLFCPMIDARRMEVFTAVYDRHLNTALPPANIVLNESSFREWLEKKRMLFFGNGSIKSQSVISHKHALFADIEVNAATMVPLSFKSALDKNFADLAYVEPFYCKDFHSTAH